MNWEYLHLKNICGNGPAKPTIFEMETTRREAMLIEEGFVYAYDLYKKKQAKAIREAKTEEEIGKAYGFIPESGLRKMLQTSDAKTVDVVLTKREYVLYQLDDLSQEEIDEICYRCAPISLWKIKKAISRRLPNKETKDKGER